MICSVLLAVIALKTFRIATELVRGVVEIDRVAI